MFYGKTILYNPPGSSCFDLKKRMLGAKVRFNFKSNYCNKRDAEARREPSVKGFLLMWLRSDHSILYQTGLPHKSCPT